jgi:uncharacterized protein
MRKFEEFHEGFTRELLFMLTEDCNLNCVYCYEKHRRRNSALSAEFVKEKICEEMLAADPCKLRAISFFGGEPLLKFDVIREVVEWFYGVSWPSPITDFIFQVTTNGTLLNDDMKQWFSANRTRVILGLSMDGTKVAQDSNRSNSYDTIIQHIDFIRENWPDQPLKMTISPHTIDLTYEGVVHIRNLGLSVEPDVVFEDVWGDEESERNAVRSWEEQLDKLIYFYLEHPEFHRPKVLTRELHRLFGAVTEDKRTFCGAGRYTSTYTADGIKFPCFRFAPICVPKPIHDILATPDIENEKCANCAFERICSSCEGVNYLSTGSCFNRTDYHCRFFMVSLLASAKLLFIDNQVDLDLSTERLSRAEKLLRMRRLLAIRIVNDLCAPIIEWAHSAPQI